jgi:hypothetical protein
VVESGVIGSALHEFSARVPGTPVRRPLDASTGIIVRQMQEKANRMHIFIDESGPFAGFHAGSIGVVGALAIPDVSLTRLARKYGRIRKSLPMEKGEVKGRLLSEKQVDKVVMLLARSEAMFEVTALDLGIHTDEGVNAYKQKHGEEMLARVGNFREDVRPEVEKASRLILETPVNLYLQALTTFDVLHRLIGHMTLFFAQRKPYELGAFKWVVDGKDPTAVTKWETWWSNYAQGALATMSNRRPAPRLEGEGLLSDYSYYDRFSVVGDDGEKGTDLKLLLKDIKFITGSEIGLEFVDVLTNAIRRTLTGKLNKEGWKNIHRTMIHRTETYIQFIFLGDGEDFVRNATYAKAVYDGFTKGGRSMLTKRNNRVVDEQIIQGIGAPAKSGQAEP